MISQIFQLYFVLINMVNISLFYFNDSFQITTYIMAGHSETT